MPHTEVKLGCVIKRIHVKRPSLVRQYPVFECPPFVDKCDFEYVVFNNSIVNAYHALIRRVMQKVPSTQVDSPEFATLLKTVKQISNRILYDRQRTCYQPLDLVRDRREFIEHHYSGGKRKLYLRDRKSVV